MSFSERLIHTCRIRKDADAGTEDDLGNPDDTRTLVAEGVRCWFTTKERKLQTSEVSGPGVIKDCFLYVEYSQELEEGYLIDSIVFEDASVDSTLFRASQVYPMRTGSAHHKRVALERVS